jgi:hypothetical protein
MVDHYITEFKAFMIDPEMYSKEPVLRDMFSFLSGNKDQITRESVFLILNDSLNYSQRWIKYHNEPIQVFDKNIAPYT